MKTQDEIVEKMKDEEKDFLGFGRQALSMFLDFEHAKSFLVKEFLERPDAEAKWNEDVLPLTEENVKMTSWIWLLEDQKTLDEMGSINYEQYGAPILAVVCKNYGLPIPEDEGVQNMIKGLFCKPDCQEGCGT
jgi:hypothetical protein